MDYKKFFDNFVLFFALLCMAGFFWLFTQMFSGNMEKLVLKISGFTDFSQSNLSISINSFDIDAKSAYFVLENDLSEKILFTKKENLLMPIASLTKLMSAIIVIDNIEFDDSIIINKDIEDWQEIKTIKIGEEFTVENLLKLSLIESNNSAIIALAKNMTQEKFVELMNAKAKEIGMQNTKFFNETGLDLKDRDSNVSTAKDLAILSKYILLNYPEIFDITKEKEFLLCDINNTNCRIVKNTNKLLDDSNLGNRILGGKTGETKIAGGCLILLLRSNIDGEYYISIILNSNDRFAETKKIINKYGE